MKDIRGYLLLSLILLFTVQLCPTAIAQKNDVLSVFVSIPPQKYLVERIGQNRVAVSIMVGPGQSPATYEPSPKQMGTLSNAKLYFQIGVPFEKIWIDRIRQLNNKLRIIECCEQIASRKLFGHAHNMETIGLAIDPHIWTSPVYVKDLVRLIKMTLINEDPKFRDFYEKNSAELINDLEKLDLDIRAEFENIRTPYFIVTHPSWGYFSDTYNLRQIVIEQHGTEIKARKMTELIELAKSEGIHFIYTQKQFNDASAYILAKELGAEVVEIDPLAENYIENLRHAARVIGKGLH